MIVVTGATGNVGGALVRILAADGAQVTATSRNISAADVPDGVRHVRSDLADPDGMRTVLDGAEALFFQSGTAAHLIDARAVLDAAKAGGVRRVVLLSSQGVGTRPDSASHGVVGKAIEDAVLDSGLDWTILRPGGFASNSYAYAESVRASRTVAAPFGDVGIPVIDPSDIAAVGASALREDGHTGQIYELTGPALVSPKQQAEAIAAAIGEPVQFVELTREQAREHMTQFMPEAVADTTLTILGEPNDAELRISPDVERVIGRAPGTFADWAARNAAAFR
ncbi:SDR family oxidoreductase [Actinomadura rupiterrae]|uniref:SDR family oxidoreductase n=1 Tax=Actinomadura rupiterrae TaxID=559627 RepID=UPI0020A4DDE5|nr:NAD(P)H-binding protein [Actinomadura rupiterrae]MCP2335402.1 uncharacterized protein YbjT (DUF2867 family) [Actinomadura rupiterrae]